MMADEKTPTLDPTAWAALVGAERQECGQCGDGYYTAACGPMHAIVARLRCVAVPALVALVQDLAAVLEATQRDGHSQACDTRRFLGDPTVGVSLSTDGLPYLGGRQPQPWVCFCGHAARAALLARIPAALRREGE